MKKIIQVCLVLSLAIVFSVVSAKAQASYVYRANIPYDFNVAGKSYPAGSYSLKVAKRGGGSAIITLTNSHGGNLHSAVAMTTGSSAKGDSVLSFLRHGNERYLAAILTSDGGIRLSGAVPKRSPGVRITSKEPAGETSTVALN